MTSATSIGSEDPRTTRVSGIEDAARSGEPPSQDGESVMNDVPQPDVTREDIEQRNDRNVSADDNNRAATTNKLTDDGFDFSKP